MTTTWDPITVGNMHLPHRVTMAPMTRSRASADGTPSPLAPEYHPSTTRSAPRTAC